MVVNPMGSQSVKKHQQKANPSETLGFSCSRMLVGNTSSLIHSWSIFPGNYVYIIVLQKV